VPLVVSGRVRHPAMPPEKVEKALRKRFPGLVREALDFSLQRSSCNVEIFCNTTSTLDFTVTVTGAAVTPPATVALLVRETDSLNDALARAMKRWPRRGRVEFCVLEDSRSRSHLLTWKNEPPLRSAPAKLSYIICLALLALAGVLTYWVSQTPRFGATAYDLLALGLAIALPAVAVPLPFVFEHLRSRGAGRWLFSQLGGGTP
jgi:hypothetical protein